MCLSFLKFFTIFIDFIILIFANSTYSYENEFLKIKEDRDDGLLLEEIADGNDSEEATISLEKFFINNNKYYYYIVNYISFSFIDFQIIFNNSKINSSVINFSKINSNLEGFIDINIKLMHIKFTIFMEYETYFLLLLVIE